MKSETIRQVLHEYGYSYQRTRTWCSTGYALRVRKSGTVTVYDAQTPEKRRLIELAYEQAEAAGIVQLNQDEAGPYQAIPQPGGAFQAAGHPAVQPHEYERGGTAKLLTLFRPATGEVRAKGVVSAPNAVLHPWLKGHLSQILREIEKQHPAESLPPEEERPLFARWKTWFWPHESAEGLPPLRIILIWDNLAGHLTPDLVAWLFQHGVMPLYTPIGGSWLNMAESIQRILVRRALSGQHPKDAQQLTLPMPEGRGFFLQPAGLTGSNRLHSLEVCCPEALRLPKKTRSRLPGGTEPVQSPLEGGDTVGQNQKGDQP